VAIILLTLLAVIACSTIISEEQSFGEFMNFQKQFGKKYATIEEFNVRYGIFKRNMELVTLKQQYAVKQNARNYSGVTKYMDVSAAEFARTHLNLKITVDDIVKAQTAPAMKLTEGVAPDSHDWRDHDAVTQVKDQGSCGSCWAFSAIGNIESQYKLNIKEDILLSEQELVSCDKGDDQGCEGGLMETAFKYLETVGVVGETDYPYDGVDEACALDGKKVLAKVTNYAFAGTSDEKQIKELLYTNGPFAIAINATPLQWYFGGIVDPWIPSLECDPASLNHGVLLVGYGSEDGKDYWIIKNSWGGNWGEKGFFRMARGKGTCGVNTYVISATVSKA